MKSRTHNSGFVLLMVMLVLTIAGTLLASSAYRSGRRVLASNEAARDLQLSWGMQSCRDFMLPSAERLLEEAEEQMDESVVTARRSVTLGDMRFDLTVADEQAKANLNIIAHRRGPEAVAPALQALRIDSREPLPIRLRPGTASRTGRAINAVPQLYVSFDQLLKFDHPSQLLDIHSVASSPVGRITCWGSGKVNTKRVDALVLRQVLAGLASETQIAMLIEARDEDPDRTLEELLADLKFSHERIKELTDSIVTDSSDCHSLWVTAHSETRTWTRLYVRQAGDGRNDAQEWTFAW